MLVIQRFPGYIDSAEPVLDLREEEIFKVT